MALSRRSASHVVSSSAPSTARTMIARLLAALTASASRGLAMVTRPAPARSAPRAASRPPRCVRHPPTPQPHGLGYICGRRAAAPETVGPQRRRIGGDARTNAVEHVVQRCRCRRPRQCRNADDPAAADARASCERTSRSRVGVDRHPHHGAAVAVDAARQIDGNTGTPAALIASIIARACPSIARSKPAPNSASTMRPAP